MTGKNSTISRQSPLSPSRLTPRTLPSSTASERLPGTAAKRNDVARLAGKYDKCVSVTVVGRSTDVENNSSNESKSSRNVTKDSAKKIESTVNNSKNRNGFIEAGKVERTVSKVSKVPIGKDQGKEIKERTSGEKNERLQNGLLREKVEGLSSFFSIGYI
jgi:hypothetical protein